MLNEVGDNGENVLGDATASLSAAIVVKAVKQHMASLNKHFVDDKHSETIPRHNRFLN